MIKSFSEWINESDNESFFDDYTSRDEINKSTSTEFRKNVLESYWADQVKKESEWQEKFIKDVHKAKSIDELPTAEQIQKVTGKKGEDLQDAVEALQILWKIRNK